MTREIKFRAWDKEKYRMLKEDTDIWFRGNLSFVKGYSGGFELMQYTGLKDKNGKEIYEGDILVNKTKNNNDGDKEDSWLRVWVVWNEKEARWGLDDNNKNGGGDYSLVYKNWEVIGNIYQNPELLK